jgi:hypothetical protein
MVDATYIHHVEVSVAYDIEEATVERVVRHEGTTFPNRDATIEAIRNEIAYLDKMLARRLRRKFHIPFEVESVIVGEEWKLV